MPKQLPKSAKDLLWRMLTVDPTKRITVREIKKHPFFLSNGFIPTFAAVPELVEDTFQCKEEGDLDPLIVKTLASLWQDKQLLLQQLLSEGYNMAKTFYCLCQRRIHESPAFPPSNPPNISLPSPQASKEDESDDSSGEMEAGGFDVRNLSNSSDSQCSRIATDSPSRPPTRVSPIVPRLSPQVSPQSQRISFQPKANCSPFPLKIEQARNGESVHIIPQKCSNGAKEEALSYNESHQYVSHSNQVSHIPDIHSMLQQKPHERKSGGEELSNEAKLRNINNFALPPTKKTSDISPNASRGSSFLPQYDQFHKDKYNDNVARSKSADEEEQSNPTVRSRANSTTSFEGKSFWSRRNKGGPSTVKEEPEKKKWTLKKKDKKSVSFAEPDPHSLQCEFLSEEQLIHVLEDALFKLRVTFKQYQGNKLFNASCTVEESVVKFTITVLQGSHQMKDKSMVPLVLEFYRESGDHQQYLSVCQQIEKLITR